VFKRVIFLVFFLVTGIGNLYATMLVPNVPQYFPYSATAKPLTDANPYLAKPVGVGSAASQGETLDLHIACEGFSEPIDLYLAFQAPLLSPELFLFTPQGILPLSQTAVIPLMARNYGPFDMNPLGSSIATTELPAGSYILYLMATPQNQFDNYYLWQTDFFIDGVTMLQIKTVLERLYTPEVALDLVLFAIEKGYSARQLVNGIIANRLLSNGAIMGEQPEWAPSGITLKSSSHLVDVSEHAAVVLEIRALALEEYSKLGANDIEFLDTLVLIDLINQGYSKEQIISALLDENIIPVMGANGFRFKDRNSETLIAPKYGTQSVVNVTKDNPLAPALPGDLPYTRCEVRVVVYDTLNETLFDGRTYEFPDTTGMYYFYSKGSFSGTEYKGIIETDMFPWANSSGTFEMQLNPIAGTNNFLVETFSGDALSKSKYEGGVPYYYDKISGGNGPVLEEKDQNGQKILQVVVKGKDVCKYISTLYHNHSEPFFDQGSIWYEYISHECIDTSELRITFYEE